MSKWITSKAATEAGLDVLRMMSKDAQERRDREVSRKALLSMTRKQIEAKRKREAWRRNRR